MSKSQLNARTKFQLECSKRRKYFQFDVATPDIKANLRLAVRLSSPPMVCPMVGYLLDARALLQQAVRGSHSQAAAQEEGACGLWCRSSPFALSLARPTDFPAATTTQIERPKSASVAALPLRFMKKINIIESNSEVCWRCDEGCQ